MGGERHTGGADGGSRCGSVTASASSGSTRGVLLVGDVIAPFDFGSPIAGRLGDRQVGHVVVCGGAVPVPDISRCDDDVTCADLLDKATARLV